ncbi:hypothetical protein GCM10027259_52340 [Micromonospora palomenae]
MLATAAQNRGALRVKQDAAPTLTCENEKPQAGVGAVACNRMPFNAVEGRSVDPVAPNLLPDPGLVTGLLPSSRDGRALQVVGNLSWLLARAP